MRAFFDMDCGGETVTIEKTDDGDIIFHGWDEETELAAIELGFKPSACWIIWNAINNDILDRELFSQAYRGNALLVKALLFVGASANAKSLDGWTPLHVAAVYGHADAAKILIDAGASVDAMDKDGWTPLHEATRWNHADVAKVLLEAGASVDARTRGGKTPFSIALDNEKYDLVKVIQAWIKEHGK